MNDEYDSAGAETEACIAHARSLPGIAWGDWTFRFRNIGHVIRAREAEAPDRLFLSDYGDNGLEEQYTNREFLTEVLRAAAVMAALGIRQGDRIATLSVNQAPVVLVYFAAWMLGVTVVPINCGEEDDRIRYILENSRAQVVFVATEQTARFAAIRSDDVTTTVVLGTTCDGGDLSFCAAMAETEPLAGTPDPDAATECLIVYTSGTTGPPKGVVLDQANLLADAHSIAAWHGFGPDDRAMCVLPIHHVNGALVTLMTPLYSGGSVVLNRKFHAGRFWSILEMERCTWTSVVPTVLAFLCERPDDLTKRNLSRFRHIICGAGPLTVELARRFDDAFHIRVIHGYGLSETTCYSCFLPIELDYAAQRHWMMECGFPSIGCPISANLMAIHDADGNTLPPDTRGEIVIRGQNVMRYYFRRPDANRDAFMHGWFRSGDEGFYRDGEDGRAYFFITGRLKELIIRGGVNYSPFDIDEVLNAIPGVKAAMAVGFENNVYGEEIGAYVQRSEGSSISEHDVIQACRDRLPFAKRPKVVVFGEEFPVTSTGKYQRNRLKPLFAAWKETQFRP